MWKALGPHARAVPSSWAVDVPTGARPAGRATSDLSSTCLDSRAPAQGGAVWEEALSSFTRSPNGSPVSSLPCPSVPRLACAPRTVRQLKGIQDSSLDLSILKQLKIIQIKQTNRLTNDSK